MTLCLIHDEIARNIGSAREGFPENIEELQERLLLQYDSICLKYRAIMNQKDIQKDEVEVKY